uniref:Phytanoyl-CoA dioxygenase n=1 Tax=Octactis speculum TaxID=3111310 RepID=A0A7S2CFW4_9STRA|mmetsp:Transcript_3495/g.3990  ORF Transcript_3495/g.3990 Transcript_3495/m.3990 type:complete len:396 (+) Transcript_3495:44-1231(+)|eukprot:CAMPEP_0185767792 /NCGR_PEP_ID=MMETSP1174-20130828/45559_1 /TAXON_ID=35687 /ORGANISM="Dictyocha speculum, Strain CCMP1381" /LENGTH=395 /DNA_ID=CAMNT_0028452143 /DNA_START=44 /DNA_END=1231 /DNA_ORIENTATION=-
MASEEMNRSTGSESNRDTYSFYLTDSSWVAFLQDHGYAVLKGVVSRGDVDKAKDMIWDDLEGAEGISRVDPTTWTSQNWRLSRTGLVGSLAQSAGPWHLRGLPAVKEAFSRIWGDDDLCTSMDAAIIWKPWWEQPPGDEGTDWRPMTEGLHLDQNPFSKPDLDCIQGMIPLLPVDETVGGLQVIPFSHTPKAKEILKKKYPQLEGVGDWCPVYGRIQDKPPAEPQLLLADAGDLILWDSRLVHGGVVGTGRISSQNEEQGCNDVVLESGSGDDALDASVRSIIRVLSENSEDADTITEMGEALLDLGQKHRRIHEGLSNPDGQCLELARMTCTLAMTPRKWASQEIAQARLEGFNDGRSFNHCPHEGGTSTGAVHAVRKPEYRKFTLSKAQRQVL